MRCDEGAIRYWATERGKPSRILRGRLYDVFGIPDDSWDSAPSFDAYALAGRATEPETRRR